MDIAQCDGRTLTLNGCRVPHLQVGSGPDLIFVHGWPLHGDTWRHVIRPLRHEFTCHLFDLPGAGGSEWNEATPISTHDHVRAVRQAIDQITSGPYAVLAQDSGGAFARAAVVDDPQLRALVLGNTEIPGHQPPFIEAMASLSRLPGAALSTRAALRSSVWRRSPVGFGSCFDDPTYADGAFYERFLAPLVASARAFDGQMRLIRNFDWSFVDSLEAAHARITAPVQLIWGARDRWFPLTKVPPMLQQFGGSATVSTIDEGKLLAHEEFPEQWARLALPFLREHLHRPS